MVVCVPPHASFSYARQQGNEAGILQEGVGEREEREERAGESRRLYYCRRQYNRHQNNAGHIQVVHVLLLLAGDQWRLFIMVARIMGPRDYPQEGKAREGRRERGEGRRERG